MASGHRFGRIVSPSDARDREFALTAIRSARTWRSWSLRGLWLDQRDTPHCVGFAAAHALWCAPLRTFADPHGIYRGCKLIDGLPEVDGTFVRAAARILRAAGAIASYHWARSVDAIVTHLLESGPIIAGTDWYEGMDQGGVMQARGAILGGHAYLLRSVNRRTGLVRVRNSWGRGWGDQGEADLPIDQLRTLLRDDGEFLLAREARPEEQWLDRQAERRRAANIQAKKR